MKSGPRLKSIGPLLLIFFYGPVRTAVSVLWFSGAALAMSAVVLTAAHPGAGSPLVFVVPAVAMAVLGTALRRSQVWAMVVSLVLLAGQIVGVVGTIYELTHGIDARKAAELHALGFDPRVGVAVNLAYSLIASILFIVALLCAPKNKL